MILGIIGNRQKGVMGSMYIVDCIMYIDDVDNSLWLVVWDLMLGFWNLEFIQNLLLVVST